MSLTRRRRIMSAALISLVIVVAFFAGAVAVSVARDAPAPAAGTLTAASVTPDLQAVARVASRRVADSLTAQIPVLVYHEMNNGCKAAAPVCLSHDYETVSTAQFRAEMSWMYGQGYHTVTLAQYLAWLRDSRTLLPPKPFLITVDNGIGNFLDGAQPVLYHFRFTAAAFLVTGFADGAAGRCATAYSGYDVQPGCPAVNRYWDLTWPQIRALSPSVYSFAMEAGASGHYVQSYSKTCPVFSACLMPGESAAAYESRVSSEYSHGIAELTAKLGARFSSRAWVVPYSDLGYPCEPSSCAGEEHTDPHNWLIDYAASHFQAVFVQDDYRNGIDHERFRYEVHGTMTLATFTASIRKYLAAGAFSLGAAR